MLPRRLSLATAVALGLASLAAPSALSAQATDSPVPSAEAAAAECGVTPLAEADRITPEAAAFGRAYVPVDEMMTMVNRKLGTEIQRVMRTHQATAELVTANPGLGAAIEQAIIELGNRCYPLHLVNLQGRAAQIMSLYATGAQLREITRFTLSPPAQRLQRAGIALAMADQGELRTMTAEQRQQMLLRQVQRTFAAMPAAERTAMVRFTASPSGQAVTAATPELMQALNAWMEEATIALLPRAELLTVQVASDYFERQAAAAAGPAIPSGTDAAQ